MAEPPAKTDRVPAPAEAGADQDASDDARNPPRNPIELKVEYKRLNAFFADYTKNISQGGTFIRTERPLAVGTEFAFKLHVPALAQPLALTGEVRWVRTLDDIEAALDTGDFSGPREPGMGIRFVFRTPEERRDLAERVEAIMVKSLGQLLYSKLMERRGAGQSGDPSSELGQSIGSAELPSED